MRLLFFSCLFIAVPLLWAAEPDLEINKRFDAISRELNAISFSNNRQAKELLAQLQQIADIPSKNTVSQKIQCLYWETVINTSQRKNDSVLIGKIKQSLNALDKQSYPFENALLHYAMALTYNTRGDYAEAFSIALQTLEKFKLLKDSTFSAKSLILLGNICSYIKSYNMAGDYYRQALPLLRPDQFEYYQLHVNTYKILFLKKQITASIDSLVSFFPKLKQYNNTGLLAVYYLNLGACYSASGAIEKAFQCYQTTLDEILSKIDNESITFSLYQNLGAYYLKNKNFQKSTQYFYLAKATAVQEDNPEQTQYAFLGLSYLYEAQGDTDSAFFYLKDYFNLSNEATNDSKAVEAYQAYASVLLDASQKELIITGQELELKSRRFMVSVILLVTIILLVGLLLIVVSQKRHIKEVENRELSERLAQEKKIQQLQEEQLESKTREITSISLLLSNKNNVFQQVLEILQTSKASADFETAKKEASNLIKNNFNADSDWETFMLHFDKVHPRFFDKLKEWHSGLTEHNLRLCAYFRIGISTKEISQILNISPESVIVYRYRLKKKLGLKEEDNLDDYLRRI